MGKLKHQKVSSINFIDGGTSWGATSSSWETSRETSWHTSWHTSGHASGSCTTLSVEFGHNGIPDIFDFLGLLFIGVRIGVLVGFEPFNSFFNDLVNFSNFFWA
jgi:hypothetical protein